MSKDLRAAIALVQGQVKAIDTAAGKFSHQDYQAYRQRHDTAVEAAIATLEAGGATCRHDWKGAAIKLAGIRSTCTSGFKGALTNWLTRARQQRDHPA